MYSFEELEVWKACRAFKINCKKRANSFPKIEEYRLKDQIYRATRSNQPILQKGLDGFTTRKIFNSVDKQEDH